MHVESPVKPLLHILPYTDALADTWDEMVFQAPMATFLHSRKFLSYHGERFQDVSVLIQDEHGQTLGLFPAAVDPRDSSRVVSHPGISYGGIVHTGKLRGDKMLQSLTTLLGYFREKGFTSLRYKAVPYIYHQLPSMDDTYALFRLKASKYRCDLSSTIDLEHRAKTSERRRRGLKSALKNKIQVTSGEQLAKPLWDVLIENLERKHGTAPVHTLEEITRLHQWFPNAIEFVAGCLDNQVVAGVVLFISPSVMHAQYIASSPTGYETSALDAIFEHCFEIAKARKIRYFDFGISNEQEGQVLNSGLYQFKTEFGGGGVTHDFYELPL